MKKLIFTLAGLGFLAGCATNDAQIREAIKKDPKIVFDLIEENPEQFIEVVNRAAQKAQQAQYQKQISEMKKNQEEDLKNPKQAKLSDDRRMSGDQSGKIVLVEYADFQCPACRMAYDSLKKFKEKHKNEVQFYFKNMPLDFHKMAMPAAQYFEAIRLQDPKKAEKFYNIVFENQKELMTDGFLKKMAKQVGADVAKVEKDSKSEKVRKIIEEDMKEFENFRFTGTPVVILNGVALNGAPRVDDLERITEMTLKK